MYFVDSEHKKFFEEHKDKCEKQGNDVLASVYFLGVNRKTRESGAINFVNMNWVEADTGEWSTSEGMIYDWAYHFFNGRGDVNLYNTIGYLGMPLFNAFLQAIAILRFGMGGSFK